VPSSQALSVSEALYARAATLGAAGAATAEAAGLSKEALVAAREAFVAHLLDAPVARMNARSRCSRSKSSTNGSRGSRDRNSASAALVLLVAWMSAGLQNASAIEVATFFGLHTAPEGDQAVVGSTRGGAPAARAVAFFAVVEGIRGDHAKGSKGKSNNSSSGDGSTSRSSNDDDGSTHILGNAAASAYLKLLIADDATKLVHSSSTTSTDTSRSSSSSSKSNFETVDSSECALQQHESDGNGSGTVEASDPARMLISLPGLVAARKEAQLPACSHWWCGVQQLVANSTGSAFVGPNCNPTGATNSTSKKGAHSRCTRVAARKLLCGMATGKDSKACGRQGGLCESLGSLWAQLKAADCDLVSDL